MNQIKKFKIKKYKKTIKPILQMKNVSKRYGQLNVLQDLNMNIMPSSITGLLGPNGSGKTTIFNILLGITKMDSGKLFINSFLNMFSNVYSFACYKVSQNSD